MARKKQLEEADDEMYYCSECGIELRTNMELQEGKCKFCKKEERELRGSSNFDHDYEEGIY
jgi:recombinational DNA repair protein RecR